MTFARFMASCTVCIVLSSPLPVRAEPPAPGFDRAITTHRLTGATLSEIARDSKIVWHFGLTRFCVEFRGDPPMALVRQLLGQETKVRQIEGEWRYDDRKSRLVLKDLEAGGSKHRQEVILPIEPAGPFHANLGELQYGISEFNVCGCWESVEKGTKVLWNFHFGSGIDFGNTLTVQCDKGHLPESLVRSLMGEPLKVSKIEGRWDFDSSTRRLRLKELRAGDHQQKEVIETTATPADVLTMQLMGNRYRRVSVEGGEKGRVTHFDKAGRSKGDRHVFVGTRMWEDQS